MADHRALLVATGELRDVTGGKGALDEIVEAVAVALLEGRTLGLAVVGEDHDLVGTGRVADRSLDAAELLVELPQRLQRVGALEAGVMGDLVVARERRVDRRPALHQVGKDAEHDEVADDHAHRASHERVDPAPMSPGMDVAPDRAQRGDPLEDHLPEEEDERTRDVVPVREEGAIAGVRALLRLHSAHREDDVVGLAGEQVPAACAPVAEEPVARVAALDLLAVSRCRARHEDASLLLDPAEGGDVLVRAQQDAGLAGARLRREVGLPLEEAVCVVGEPACHRGRVAVAHRSLEDRLGKAVDLQEQDSRRLRHDSLAGLASDALDNADRVRVVVVRSGDDLERCRDSGDHEGRDERRAEPVDGHRALGDRVREEQERGVEDEHHEEGRRDGVRELYRPYERREDRVQDRDDERDEKRRPECPDVEPGQDQGGDEHAYGVDEQRDEEPCRA